MEKILYFSKLYKKLPDILKTHNKYSEKKNQTTLPIYC